MSKFCTKFAAAVEDGYTGREDRALRRKESRHLRTLAQRSVRNAVNEFYAGE